MLDQGWFRSQPLLSEKLHRVQPLLLSNRASILGLLQYEGQLESVAIRLISFLAVDERPTRCIVRIYRIVAPC